MTIFYRLGATVLLALCSAMIWTPAHASFPAPVVTTYSAAGFTGTSIIGVCTQAFNAAAVGKNSADGAPGKWTYSNVIIETPTMCAADLFRFGVQWSHDGIMYSTVGTVPTCPASSTLAGGVCTCTAPNVENASHDACEMPQTCKWAEGMSYAAGSDTFTLERGKNFCLNGCAFALDPTDPPSFSITHGGKKYDEVRLGNLVGTGEPASNCGAGDGIESPSIDPPENPPDAPDQSCPPGQSAGPQIIAPGGGGGYMCVTPEQSEANKKKTVETTAPDGTKTTTTTEETTVCGVNSCNTTTTTSVSSGGTTSTSDESSTSSKDDFCKAKPADKNCTGTGGAGTGNAGGDQGSPDHPKLWEQKYPDGLAGVWAEKKAAFLNTDIGKLAPSLMPNNIPNTGALPVWNVPLDFGPGMNYGLHDVAPSAEIWGWAKIFLIISALLLARALIFGG
jgi:hypothetical protein